MSTLTQKPIQWFRLLLSLLVCQLVGGLGAMATFPNIAGWYAGLQKPDFNPPNAVFGPVWTTLYLIMGLALYRVWVSDTPDSLKRQAFVVFFIQLGLNAVWSVFFFGLHNPLLGLVDIVALWLAILFTARLFAGIDRPAAWMMAPYLIWVSYAACLNFAIWRLN